jgi:hypothetical protein
MRGRIILLLGFVSFIPGAAAGPYDGTWVAQAPAQGRCNPPAKMTLNVRDAAIVGTVDNPNGTFRLSGTLDASGNGTIRIGDFAGTVRFTGERFEANFSNTCGQRQVAGTRTAGALGTTAQKSEAAARYAELSAKALAGDTSIDFTALRTAYPMTDHYDPYMTKTAPLVDASFQALKAGDCVTALAKADEILKIDFTLLTTHGVRSDCLARAGDQREADLASAILRALGASLRGNADGKGEATAYRVISIWERDYLLFANGITGTGSSTIRGGDGHVYQVVNGTTKDGNSVSVYFDMNLLVADSPTLIPLIMQGARFPQP